MDRSAAQTTAVLKSIHTEIETHLYEEDWEALALSLHRLIAIGERLAQRELCLKAQRIRELSLVIARGGASDDSECRELKHRLIHDAEELSNFIKHFKWALRDTDINQFKSC